MKADEDLVPPFFRFPGGALRRKGASPKWLWVWSTL